MARFRATVWVLSAMAAAVEGWEGLTRRVVEREAPDEGMFKAQIRDDFTRNVDDEVWFGPVTQK